MEEQSATTKKKRTNRTRAEILEDNNKKRMALGVKAREHAKNTMVRQLELGITEYEWSTAGDERTCPACADNDGKKFRWDNPPEETGHPGFGKACECGHCRCVALAVIETNEVQPKKLKQTSKINWLWVGIFVVPFVFVWLLLREKHTKLERIIGFGWLAIFLIAQVAK